MAGIRMIREAIDAGELGRVAFIEANFSNERALELTPKTWRWYKDRAPGGPLSQLAIHQFDVLHYLGGEIVEVSSMASKLSPVGAEVDDQSMTLLKFADGKVGYVGLVLDLARRLRGARVRLQGPDALRDRFRHLGYAGPAARVLDALHPARQGRLRQARGAEGPGKRHVPRRARDVRRELPHRESRTSSRADNGNVAVAVVYAALRSIEQQRPVASASPTSSTEARARVAAERSRHVA